MPSLKTKIEQLKDGNENEKHKAKILEDLWEATIKFNRFVNLSYVDNEIIKPVRNWMAKVERIQEKFCVSDKNHDIPDTQALREERRLRKEYQIGQLHAYWSLMTPTLVAGIVKLLGNDAERFLNCLSVKITEELRNDYPGLFHYLRGRASQPIDAGVDYDNGKFDDACKFHDDSDDDIEEKWERLAPTIKRQEMQASRFTTSAIMRQEMLFFWCGVHKLLDVHSAGPLLSALAGKSESAFSTPVAVALVEYSWHEGRWFFAFDRLLEIIFIVLLFRVAYQGHECRPWIESCIMPATGYVLFSINVIGIMTRIIELGVKFISGSKRDILPTFLDLFKPNVASFCFAIEIISACQVLLMMNRGMARFIKENPIMFSLVILLKWMQLSVGFLITPFFGLTVLPAYKAMISADSVKFLLFVMLFVVASTHAYYGLPLDGDGFEGDILAFSFMRMFRLGILGDFDFFELEGVDPTLEAELNVNKGTVIGQIDESDVAWDKGTALHRIHVDMRILLLGLTFLITVVLMNMYIGILGNQYNNAFDKKLELFQYSRAAYLERFMLRLNFFRFLFCRDKSRADDGYDSSGDQSDTDYYTMLQRQVTESRLGAPYVGDQGDDEHELGDIGEVPDWFVENGLPKSINERNSGCWIIVPSSYLPEVEVSDAEFLQSYEETNRKILAELKEIKNQMNSSSRYPGY